MRTDVRINRRQSDFLPNSITSGYGKYKAQFGDVVLFKQSETCTRIGRVIGKIGYAPRLGLDPDMRGWLVCAVLGQNLTHVMERWVSPADVIECYDPEPEGQGGRDMIALLSFFFGEDFKSQSIETLRGWINYGQPDFAKYKAATTND